MMIVVVVIEPWPISGTEFVIVTSPSRSILSHWLGANTPAVCACADSARPAGRRNPMVSPAPTARPP